MPITCESGFSSYFPPFMGNVRIRDFRLSKYAVEAGESVRALGRAEVQKWTPYNPWGPLSDKPIEIIWAWAGAPKKVAAAGRTNGDGSFDVEFEGPYVTMPRTVEVWASLPRPSGGYPEDHLECGPLELRGRPKREEEEGVPIYLYVAPVVGIGLGWLASR